MDLFKDYFSYVGATEAPDVYHRWTLISILGAMLGRRRYLPFGHGVIYPNQYIMLMGSPGTRKGTAMNIGAKLLRGANYKRFCPDRLSKERFLIEIKPYDFEELLGDDADLTVLEMDTVSEIYAFAEEFTDLVGQGGMEFMTMLTKLWDNMSRYEHPKIHGRSIAIDKPTVNLFGGNTVQGLALAIPAEALDNGFMSRMLLIHGEPTGKKITFPEFVNPLLKEQLIAFLISLRESPVSPIEYTKEAKPLLDEIYRNAVEVDDGRFKHYQTRRFIHLLKLCMVVSVALGETEITAEVVIRSNTYLANIEGRMPKALGEFGSSKYNKVSSAILEILNKRSKPVSPNELWKLVGRDLTKMTELSEIMKNLILSDKAQVITVATKQGYMSKVVAAKEWPAHLVDNSLLTTQERER